MDFVLASASPRRAELLRAAGFGFDVLVADVDETVQCGESPEAYVRRVAAAKAQAVAARVPGRQVLAADTTVVAGGEILGKPMDAADATRMLRLLSGRTHEVLTAVCLNQSCEVEVTEVDFVALTTAEIEWYVASGEPMDKAGAYAIQGLASRFVSAVRGSYSNVVGLPISRVYAMWKRI
jgi:septum formation protein